MSRTIYVEYRDLGQLANAHSVTLASEDGTYGIKTAAGAVIVASGTAVTNPSTGLYQYVFNPVNGIIYTVSWKIVPTSGGQARYAVQDIGPFEDSQGSIRSVAEMLGTATCGTMITTRLFVTSIGGQPRDPENITVEITRNDDGAVVDTDTPEKVATGFYVYDWSIPYDQTPGSHTITWIYTLDGQSRTELQSVILAVDGRDSTLYSSAAIDMRMRLEYMIRHSMRIPVRNEYASPSFDGKTYRFTFPMWNQSASCQIYRNKKLVTSGIEIDYFRGQVTFDEPLSSYDRVFADYNFRWFSDQQLSSFIENAVNTFNTFPPHSRYSANQLASYATRYVPAVMARAATDAMREMMFSLAFQEPQQVFGGLEGSDKAFSRLESLKKNWEEEWKLIFENKKYGPYPRLSIISVPEYTMPGGRSRWFRYLFTSATG